MHASQVRNHEGKVCLQLFPQTATDAFEPLYNLTPLKTTPFHLLLPATLIFIFLMFPNLKSYFSEGTWRKYFNTWPVTGLLD